jgi:hypothetical protein
MVTTVESSSVVVLGSSLLFTTSSVFPGLEAVAVAVLIILPLSAADCSMTYVAVHKSQWIATYVALPSTIARPHANRL